MWKFVLLGAVIIYVFRDDFRQLAPYWRSLAAVGLGVTAGILYSILLCRFGVLDQVARALGMGPKGFALIVIAVSAIMGAKTFSPLINALFPKGRDND